MWALYLIAGILIAIILRQKRIIFIEKKERFSNNDITKLLNNLPKNCIVLHDIYIPRKYAADIRINHIVINQNGLFVIEAKNHNGLIKGSENCEYWTQVVGDHQEHFYNPILQNSHRIKDLQNYLRDALHNVPVHSVIVFGKHAFLRLDKPITKATVIKRYKLTRVLMRETKNTFVYYRDRQAIKDLLSAPYLDKSVKRRKPLQHHIIDLNQYKSRSKKSSM